jgi:acetylornithine deacetylase
MTRETVLRYIDQHAAEMIDFLKKYVSIPSVNTGIEGEGKEKEVQEWLAETLRGYGLAVDTWAEDAKKVRPNVVATLKGKGGGQDLILNGHSDVVAVNEPEKWTADPWNPVIRDGKLFGRGASDMKGGNAAAIWAVKALKDCGADLKGDVFLQLVVGEESNEGKTIGTTAAIKRGYKAPFAIVVEPTNLEIHLASVSLFFFEIIVPGKAVHVCCRNQVVFPQPYGLACGAQVGVDAVKKALPFIELFYKLEAEWNQRWRDPILGAGGHPTFDKQGVGVFTVNPAIIEGGTYLASISGQVKITYSVWHPNSVPAETIWEEIRQAVSALASTDDWLKEHPPVINVPILQEWKGYAVSEDLPGVVSLKRAIKNTLRQEAVISGFKAVCDSTYLNNNGIPAVTFGPGNLDLGVHGDDEYIPISQLIDAAKVYASFILDWCG